jgi:hypothetical protein
VYYYKSFLKEWNEKMKEKTCIIIATVLIVLIASGFFVLGQKIDAQRTAFWASERGQTVMEFYETFPEVMHEDYDTQEKKFEQFIRKKRAIQYAKDLEAKQNYGEFGEHSPIYVE